MRILLRLAQFLVEVFDRAAANVFEPVGGGMQLLLRGADGLQVGLP